MNASLETRERPILMAGEMVRAILDGRKTETRRVVKPQPPKEIADKIDYWIDTGFLYGFGKIAQGTDGSQLWPYSPGLACKSIRNPYGEVGGRLLVREAFRIGTYRGSSPCGREDYECVVFKADGEGREILTGSEEDDAPRWLGKKVSPHKQSRPIWKPSIHMPRWASRITLEITDIRIDRLKLITEAAARAEGIRSPLTPVSDDRRCRNSFRLLWDSINSESGYGWEENPWIWVVQFKRVLSQVS